MPAHAQLQTSRRVKADGNRSITPLLRSLGLTQSCGQLSPVPLGPTQPLRLSEPTLGLRCSAGIEQMSPRNPWLHASHSSMGTLSRWARSIRTAVIEIHRQVFSMRAGPSCSLRLAGIQQVSDGRLWLWQAPYLPFILKFVWGRNHYFVWYSTNTLLRFIKRWCYSSVSIYLSLCSKNILVSYSVKLLVTAIV